MGRRMAVRWMGLFIMLGGVEVGLMEGVRDALCVYCVVQIDH